MKNNLRSTAVILAFVCGIVVSMQLDTGLDDTEHQPAAYSAADPAVFEISLRRGLLLLAGNTVSQNHERQLRQAADRHFPDVAVDTRFRSLGVAPEWWSEASIGLLSTLTALHSPTARLSADQLSVTGLVPNEAVAEMQMQLLKNTLPESVTFDIRLERVANDAASRAICARQFAEFEAGPIMFEESGTRFRSSANPVLDRIVALADACRDSTVSITGHTDSSGDETVNQQLSLARASAVASYLEAMGIDPERIIVVGAGSSLPVADNATRFGRSLNRRIDVQMTAGRPD